MQRRKLIRLKKMKLLNNETGFLASFSQSDYFIIDIPRKVTKQKNVILICRKKQDNHCKNDKIKYN